VLSLPASEGTSGRVPTMPHPGLYARIGKRLLDAITATGILIAIAPLLMMVWLAVRIRLGRPALFVQERIGLAERPFTLYKFRTMTDDRDTFGQLLPDESRLTGFGRFLRSTSLDELPELWNVIKGDMSLVGPRPLLRRYLPYYTDAERVRAAVRPGITGLAQLEGRNLSGWTDRFASDVAYVQQMSLVLDGWILLRTLPAVLTRRGVQMGNQGVLRDLDVERSSASHDEERA